MVQNSQFSPHSVKLTINIQIPEKGGSSLLSSQKSLIELQPQTSVNHVGRGAPLRVEGRRWRFQDLSSAGRYHPQERIHSHKKPSLQGTSLFLSVFLIQIMYFCLDLFLDTCMPFLLYFMFLKKLLDCYFYVFEICVCFLGLTQSGYLFRFMVKI